jgi:cytochrome c oxidase assembly protein subunit 15
MMIARFRAVAARVRADGFTPREFRTICVVSLASLCAIVVSGAAVRLSGSGLGCVDWPTCNDQKVVDISTGHAAIEQINRLFTFVVGIAVVLAAVASWFRRPRRRDLVALSVFIVLGIPGQVLIGAWVVRTELNPAVVQLHFVLSMVLVALAVFMLARSGEPDTGVRVVAVRPRTRRAVLSLTVWTAAVLLVGTLVTGTGPHAGDENARRFTFVPLRWLARIHGTLVWITVGHALLLWWSLRTSRDRRTVGAPLAAWLGVALCQGALGYWQYFAGVPAGLVAAHVAGATALWAVTAWLWCSTTRRSQSAHQLVNDQLSRRRARRSLVEPTVQA